MDKLQIKPHEYGSDELSVKSGSLSGVTAKVSISESLTNDSEEDSATKNVEDLMAASSENTNEHKCNICNQSFSTTGALETHMFAHSVIKPICHVCGKIYSNASVLNKHLLLHSRTNSYTCDVCHTTLASADTLKRHNLLHSCGKQHQCHVCGKSFKTPKSLKDHMLIHSEYRCNVCTKLFTEANSLEQHIQEHSHDKNYRCTKCNKEYSRINSLNQHMRTHSRNIRCELCDKTFCSAHSLTKHMVIHSGIKPHKCDFCLKTFADPCSLRRHKLIHSGVKPHKCEVCKKAFTQSGDLKQHVLKLHIQKPFKCDLCRKSFATSSHLERHVQEHSGQKPFKCNLCDKYFSGPKSLYNHMFKCSVCKKEFCQKRSLRNHMVIHSGEKAHRNGSYKQQVQVRTPTKYSTLENESSDSLDAQNNALEYSKEMSGLKSDNSMMSKSNEGLYSLTSANSELVSSETEAIYTGNSPLLSETSISVDTTEKSVERLHVPPESDTVSQNRSEYSNVGLEYKTVLIGPTNHKTTNTIPDFTENIKLGPLQNGIVLTNCSELSDMDTQCETNKASQTTDTTIHTCDPRCVIEAHIVKAEPGDRTKQSTDRPMNTKYFEFDDCEFGSYAKPFLDITIPVTKTENRHEEQLVGLTDFNQVIHMKADMDTKQVRIQSRPILDLGNVLEYNNADIKCENVKINSEIAKPINTTDSMRVLQNDEDPLSANLSDTGKYNQVRISNTFIQEPKSVSEYCKIDFKYKTIDIDRAMEATPNSATDLVSALQFDKEPPAALLKHTNRAPAQLNNPDNTTKDTKLFMVDNMQEIQSRNKCAAASVLEYGSGIVKWEYVKPSHTADKIPINTMRDLAPAHVKEATFNKDSVGLAAVNNDIDNDKVNTISESLTNDSEEVSATKNEEDLVAASSENTNEHKCNICNQSLSTTGALETHMLAHSVIKPICHICGKMYSCASVLNKHLLLHSRTNSYMCDVCHTTLVSADTLKRHKLLHSCGKQHQCHVCGKSFKTQKSLNEHMLIHSEYRCNVCTKLFTEANSLKQHIQEHSHDKKYRCAKCNKEYSRINSLNQHMRIHSRSIKCELCDKTFCSSTSLKLHMVVHSGISPYECDVCQKVFSHPSGLRRHKLIHSGIKLHKCEVCDKTFTQSGDLKQHVLRLHIQKPFKCDLCMKTFATSIRLEQHMRAHAGLKQFKCNLCDKYFSGSKSLNNHMFQHMDYKQYKCSICKKSFKALHLLQKHSKRHDDDRPKKYRCHLCTKAFFSAANLQRHILIHSDSKNHTCDGCNKSFTQERSLKKHIMLNCGDDLHTCDVCRLEFVLACGLKQHMLSHLDCPFKCYVCDKVFKHSSSFQSHLLVHSDTKAYKCEECNKKFALRGNLKAHMAIHAADNPTKCDVCNNTFSTMFSLKRHKATHIRYENEYSSSMKSIQSGNTVPSGFDE